MHRVAVVPPVFFETVPPFKAMVVLCDTSYRLPGAKYEIELIQAFMYKWRLL